MIVDIDSEYLDVIGFLKIVLFVLDLVILIRYNGILCDYVIIDFL